MRTPASRAATSAVRFLTRDHPPSITTHVSRSPYLCVTCRIAAVQHPQPQPKPPQPLARRAFSTTTRSLNNPPSTGSSSSTSTASASASAAASSQAVPQQTLYSLFPKTFPSGPPPASPFLPDLRALRTEFLALQTQTHPDRFAGSAKAAAEARSAALNDAYRTLGDPLRHANYLLTLHGVDTEDESAKLEDAALLMEVMEARERVDAADSEAALRPETEANSARMQASVAALDALVAARRWEEAGREAVRLRYWRNVEESIRGWEKGQGGGLLHH